MERESTAGKFQCPGDADLIEFIERAIRVMDLYINVPESRRFKEDWAARCDQKEQTNPNDTKRPDRPPS